MGDEGGALLLAGSAEGVSYNEQTGEFEVYRSDFTRFTLYGYTRAEKIAELTLTVDATKDEAVLIIRRHGRLNLVLLP